MKKIVLLLLTISLFISCSHNSSVIKLEFSMNVEEYDLDANVVNLVVTPNNLKDRYVMYYKIANGEKSKEWFGCQGVYCYPQDEKVEIKVTKGIYTIYALLTDGTEYVTTYEVKTEDSFIDNNITITYENEIVLLSELNIQIEQQEEIDTVLLYKDAKTLEECLNVSNSSDIITDTLPFDYETDKNEVLTLYLKTISGDEYIKIIYISNVDEIIPSIVTEYDKESKNLEKVEVSVNAVSNNGIKKVLYGLGKKDKDYFKNNGIDITKEKTFYVYENSYYTIYAEDNYGLGTIIFIEIKNIIQNRPKIGLSLSNINYTNQNIQIAMNVDYGEKVKKIEKYALGEYDAQWFQNNGTVYESAITVKSNGIYSFYAENDEGICSVTEIEVTNIDKDNPEVEILSTGTEATSSKETSIDVIVSDYSGVQDIILAEGVCSVQTIFSGYYYELDNYKENKYSCVVKENGTYTLGVKDNAGNWTLKTVTISNIDNEKPGQIVNLNAIYNNGTITLTWQLPSDKDLESIRIKWIQDISDYSSMEEILLDKDTKKYELLVNKEIQQCMIFVSLLDEAGNEGIGVQKNLTW